MSCAHLTEISDKTVSQRFHKPDQQSQVKNGEGASAALCAQGIRFTPQDSADRNAKHPVKQARRTDHAGQDQQSDEIDKPPRYLHLTSVLILCLLSFDDTDYRREKRKGTQSSQILSYYWQVQGKGVSSMGPGQRTVERKRVARTLACSPPSLHFDEKER